MNDVEHRLRTVETDLAAFKGMTDERIKTLFVNLGALTTTLDKLATETARLNVNIETERQRTMDIKSQLCQAPNLCLELKPKLERHEQILNEQRGGWKALAAIGSACVAAGAFLGWLADHAITLLEKH